MRLAATLTWPMRRGIRGLSRSAASPLPLQLGANIVRPAWLRQEHEIFGNVADPFPTCRDENFNPRPAQRGHARKVYPINPARQFDVREYDANIGCVVV
jgi:hypothetical protein